MDVSGAKMNFQLYSCDANCNSCKTSPVVRVRQQSGNETRVSQGLADG